MKKLQFLGDAKEFNQKAYNLHIQVLNCDIKGVRREIKAGAPVNRAVHAKIMESFTDVIKWMTPLHIAAMKGCDVIAIDLIKAGANVYSVDALYRTPMHYAAMDGYDGIVDYLLFIARRIGDNNPLPILMADDEGKNPLHYAREENHPNVIAMLEQAYQNAQAMKG